MDRKEIITKIGFRSSFLGMKLIAIFLLTAALRMPTAQTVWLTDMKQATAQAEQSDKMILLTFAGSDWCGPAIRMNKDFFETEMFQTYVQKHLILLRADFPRLKKNQLSEELAKRNEILMNKYDSQGKFPFTVLLDAKGEVIQEWEGLPENKVEDFLLEIDKAIRKQ